MAETFLTVEQAAKRLQIAPFTMRAWLRSERLHGVKLGRAWRVPESALRQLARGGYSGAARARFVADEALTVDELLDATAVGAHRAGYQTPAEIERLISEVRAELGHDGPRRTLRENRKPTPLVEASRTQTTRERD